MQHEIGGLKSQQDIALAEVAKTPHLFRVDYPNWLAGDAGWAIFRRFVEEADKIRSKGRDHYSARTLFEVIRHETALREADDVVKINNVWAPDSARLYMRLRQCEGFFETRCR